MIKKLPSVEYLKECFKLDVGTGQLTWKVRPLEHFSSEHQYKIFRTRNAGKSVGRLDGKGYLRLGLDGEEYATHRIIYKLHYYKEPGECIDHEDGDTLNNRPSNLRDTTLERNQRNRRINDNNTSGVTGVTWEAKRKGWLARGQIKGKTKNLGVYDTIEKAAHVRQLYMEAQGNYTERHGT